MTTYTNFWIKCPKCMKPRLMDGYIIGTLKDDDFEPCHKCKSNLVKTIKETIKEYHEFVRIICKLQNKFHNKDQKIIDKLERLSHIYSKVITQ